MARVRLMKKNGAREDVKKAPGVPAQDAEPPVRVSQAVPAQDAEPLVGRMTQVVPARDAEPQKWLIMSQKWTKVPPLLR